MKRLLFVLLSIAMGGVVGCTAPQADMEEGSTASARSEDGGPGNSGVEPVTLQMRAPAPTIAVRPRERDAADAETPPVDERPDVTSSRAYRLKKSDPVRVKLQGIPDPQIYEDIVDERGMITLPYIEPIRAEGKTSSELEKIIFEKYVPDFYRYMTVTVLMPTERSYFVRGEVNAPGQFLYSPGITLLQAISSARGYNDFANPKKVKVLRSNKSYDYNMMEFEKSGETGPPIEPGDVIIVPRRWL